MVLTRSKSAKEAAPYSSHDAAPPSPASCSTSNTSPTIINSPHHHQLADAPGEQEVVSLPLSPNNQRSFPYRRCAGCCSSEETRAADVWCCECSRCFCHSCDERRHGTGDALDSLHRPLCSHRVELIVDGGGVPLLSSVLEIAVIVSAIRTVRPLLSAAGDMLTVDYFFESICPVVKRLRLVVFRIDHALYPLVRGPLGAWCDTEDAFIKIFADVWVRGVLTNTDSFSLLCMKIPMTLGALIIVLAVAPLLAIPYAMVATVVRMVELVMVPNCALTRALARATRYVNMLLWMPLKVAGWCARSTALGLLMDNEYQQHFHRRLKIPPKTGHRIRPTVSYGIDDMSISALNRVTRVFVYFHRKARRTIVGTVLTAVFVAVIIRIMLLSWPRCGKGILSVASVDEFLDVIDGKVEDINRPDESVTAPLCVSVHALIRKYAERLGVETPNFEVLGEEAQVLAKLQDSTEDDYIDQVLRLTMRAFYRHFSRYPLLIRIAMCILLFAFCSVGVLRRLLHWIDLRRRYRYSDALRKSEVCKDANENDKNRPKTGLSDEHALPIPIIDLDMNEQRPVRATKLKKKTQ